MSNNTNYSEGTNKAYTQQPPTPKMNDPTTTTATSNNSGHSNHNNKKHYNKNNTQKNNSNSNTSRDSNNRDNNSRKNNYRRNKQYNNQQQPQQQQPQQQPYQEEFDEELQLAFELSKLEFEKEKQNHTSSDFISNNDNNRHSTFEQEHVHIDKMKTKKKNTIDMTHLIQFKPRNPVNYQQQGYRNDRNERNDRNDRYNNHHYHNNNNNSHYSHNQQHHNYHKQKQKQPIKKKDGDVDRRSTFLQANYLFKINPIGNYTSALKSADHFVAWNKVEQVVYPTETEFLCPICFDPPFAPKITKCGHVTCYSCILRNLQHTDKCPLCLVPILKEDLKSVQFKSIRKYRVGDKITFQLLCYNQETNVPFLSTQTISNEISFPTNNEPNAPFSRFSIINNIDDIIEKELEQIYRAQAIADSEHEVETIVSLSEAEKDILERQKNFTKLMESKLHNDEKNYITVSSPQQQQKQHEFDSYQCSNNFEIRVALENYYNSVDSPSSSEDDSLDYNSSSGQLTPPNNINTTPTTTTTTTTTRTNSNSNNNTTQQQLEPTTIISNLTYENQPFESIYYLYQSNDGQDIYLHPLCMKILDREFKQGKNLPASFESNIVELETFEVTKKSRHLFKVLNMVTLTSSITFAEIDLTNLVSKSTLSEFASQLKQRKDIRLKKKRDEEKKLKIKEKERLTDIKRSRELSQIYQKEKEAEAEKEKQRLEEYRLEEEERLKNQPAQSSKKLGFLEAIQSHKNIDSIKEFPSLH
ncbi:hypothetical protein CYY_008864 [Polysphondylium violaceum]|uniref:RING-type domain-containing protein n=1 Tax=Polysphondylium violaceum TaxID=133409 RepID=A0A8J4PMG6_9MYCE|nr:hypothetical protein CYY_008864 [Polysphondylium violaceum]